MKNFRTVLIVGFVLTVLGAGYFLTPNIQAGVRQDGWNVLKWVGGYALAALALYGTVFGIKYQRLSKYKAVVYNTIYNTIHVVSLNDAPVKDWVRVDERLDKWESQSQSQNYGHLGSWEELDKSCMINGDDSRRLVLVFNCHNQQQLERFVDAMVHYRGVRERANQKLQLVHTGGVRS